MTETLLEDDFSALEIGQFSTTVGAHTEYHYLPEAAPKGGWMVAAFRSGLAAGEAWKVQQINGAQVMAQTYENPLIFTHPMLSAGSPLWCNYSVELRFTPQARHGVSGLAFRFHNSRCYYFFGLNESGIVLKMVQHETDFQQPYEEILAAQPCTWKTGQTYDLRVTTSGSYLSGKIEGLGVLAAEDDRYPQGQLTLLADAPTLFHAIKITAEADEIAHANLMKSTQQRALEDLRAANPKPVLWKKISTSASAWGATCALAI